MAKHFELQSKLDALDGTLGTLDKENFEQRQLLLGILVHASDISHPVLRMDLALVLAHRNFRVCSS